MQPRPLPRCRTSTRLGDAFTTWKAVECHLANAVLQEHQVLDYARQVAERFYALPQDAVRETKELMRCFDTADVAQAITLKGQVLSERLDSQAAREAFSAFLQKRQPGRGLS